MKRPWRLQSDIRISKQTIEREMFIDSPWLALDSSYFSAISSFKLYVKKKLLTIISVTAVYSPYETTLKIAEE